MTSLLEERYRRVLRLLPADYRHAWEEDMVDSFLQGAYDANPEDPEGVEISSPSRAEVASVAALALRLRLGGTGAAPRRFARAEAIRLVALAGLLAHVVTALTDTLTMAWMVWRLDDLIGPDGIPEGSWLTDRWHALWALAGLLWLPAYLSLLFGHRRAARVLAVVALLPMLFSGAVGPAGYEFTSGQAYALFFGALPVLALAAFHQDAPPIRYRPWLIAVPVGVALALAVQLPVHLNSHRLGAGRDLWLLALVDWPGLWCTALAGATVMQLVATRRSAIPSRPLALALLVAAAFGLRLATTLDYFRWGAPDNILPTAVGAVQCAVMLAAGGYLITVAARGMRRLPAPSAATGADARHG
ncbi:hypothetical protein [Couchioplanes caeruleus]|uniref:Uncharacterized protein n=2 Tax=Couchioplanes caeruleus TaxID=56438 RepID=A0A1K0FQQ3_9ACTN|nr:hypothetical protein [Couchioplanes caeruleus]OJF15157.1 hypothetical protein BG844_06010 [Couchioplanes caeruleus subsp. caeruleus]ROP28672.1 hypothetical protein EDD30_1441 [Couchioplanes caeruleus]